MGTDVVISTTIVSISQCTKLIMYFFSDKTGFLSFHNNPKKSRPVLQDGSCFGIACRNPCLITK